MIFTVKKVILFLIYRGFTMAQLKYPEKKKRHTGLKIFITSLVILLVSPIVVAYALFFDSTTKEISVSEDITTKEMGRNLVVDSLENTKNDGLINIKVTPEILDQFLYTATKNIQNQYITKFYTEIKKDSYKFYVDLRVPLFQTRACVTATLSETEDKSAFYFKIKNVNLGRLGGMQGIVSQIVSRYFTEESVNQMISDANLHMVFNMKDMSLTYRKIDLLNDIKGGESAGEFEMYFDIMRSVIESDLLTITTKANESLSGQVDLRNFKTNFNYVTDDPGTQIYVQPSQVEERVKEPILSLLRDGYIDHQDNNLTYLFRYLFGGYDFISDSQEIVDEISNINLSSIGIHDYTTYQGFDLYDKNSSLLDDMQASIDVASLAAGGLDLCELQEQQVNDFLKTKDIIGFTTVLDRKKEDGTHAVNYIAIDNFYCNLYQKDGEQIADFIAKINVNGYTTSLIFHTTVPEDGASGTKIKFSIKNLYYGTYETDSIKQSLFGIVQSALSHSDGIQIEPETFSITFDFSSVISSAKNNVETQIESATGVRPDLSDKFNGENITVDVIGDNKEANGTLKLKLINPLF